MADAAYACHQSLVAIPGDFNPVVKPLSLALESKDSLLGKKEIGQIKELLPKNEFQVKCECMKTRSMGLPLEVTGVTRKISRQWMTLKIRGLSGLRSAYYRFSPRSGVYQYAITEI